MEGSSELLSGGNIEERELDDGDALVAISTTR